jgi:hypothetical protein
VCVCVFASGPSIPSPYPRTPFPPPPPPSMLCISRVDRLTALQELERVHGIGPVFAKELLETHGIRTLTDLLAHTELYVPDPVPTLWSGDGGEDGALGAPSPPPPPDGSVPRVCVLQVEQNPACWPEVRP